MTTTTRVIPMCRDWRVRYVDAQGSVTHEYVTNAPTAFFARWNARDHWGLMAAHNAHKVTCWPMPAWRAELRRKARKEYGL